MYSYRDNIDNAFAAHVDAKLNYLDKQESLLYELEDGPVTIEEIQNEIRNMKTRKAPGWDMVTSENLKHGGPTTISTVTWVINKIVRNESIPQHLKRGLMIPIPKPNKDKAIKDNNRGITLITVLFNLLERVLLA